MLGFTKSILSDFRDINCSKILYCSYIRSILEYACQMLFPFYGFQIDALERVRRRFLRFVGYKLRIPADELNSNDLANSLNLPSLLLKRKYLNICT